MQLLQIRCVDTANNSIVLCMHLRIWRFLMSKSTRDRIVDKLTTEWLTEERKVEKLIESKADQTVIKTGKNRVSVKQKKLLMYLRKAFALPKNI